MDRNIVVRTLMYASVIGVIYVVMEHGNSIEFDRFYQFGGQPEATPDATSFLTKSADQMTEADIIRYIRFTNSTSCRISQDFGGKMVKANGKSGMDGQRPVCFDLGVLPKWGSCIVYTTHNGESSFYNAFEEFGCNVFVFDNADDEDRDESPHLHMINMKIRAKNREVRGKKARTLKSVYETLSMRVDHGDADIDYVKLDIEGAEWELISELAESPILGKIKQLTIELHYSNNTLPGLRNYVATLKSLEAAGMVRFANRPNIFWPKKFFGINDYSIQETSWYNQKFYFE